MKNSLTQILGDADCTNTLKKDLTCFSSVEYRVIDFDAVSNAPFMNEFMDSIISVGDLVGFPFLDPKTQKTAMDFFSQLNDDETDSFDKENNDPLAKVIRSAQASGYGLMRGAMRLLSGSAWIIDPINGKTLRSSKCLVLHSRATFSPFPGVATTAVVYFFQGVENYAVIHGGGFLDRPRWLIFLSRDESIHIDKIASMITREWKMVYSLLVRELTEPVINHLVNCTGQNKCLLIDGKANLGHFLWNDIAGVASLQFVGFNKLNLSNTVFLENRYLEDCASTMLSMPWLGNCEIVNASKINEWIVDNDVFISKAESHRLGDEGIVLIKEIAQKKATEPFFLLKERIQGFFPRVVFTVRSHNKSLLNEESILQRTVNLLNSYGGTPLIILDGVEGDKPTIERYKEIFSPHIKLETTLGLGVWDLVVLYEHVDAYIGAVGSGLAIPSWIWEVPCVCYGDKGHLTQKKFWNLISAKDAYMEWMSIESIEQKEERPYADFSVDEAAYAEAFKRILDKMVN